MRICLGVAIATAVLVLIPAAGSAQGQIEGSRKVSGGGISAPGWKGKADPGGDSAGMSADDAKFTKHGDTFEVSTGPAMTYWNPSDQASGNYTVKATFNEPKYMNLNTHPHPYGIFIGGTDMGTPQQKYLYCAAYGSGKFIVRGFGPEPFQMNGRRGEENDAVHKAEAPGQPVTQEIEMSVKGDKVDCAINGKTVATYDKSAVVGDGKLQSTNGVYGLRFAHNTEVNVTGFTMTKQ